MSPVEWTEMLQLDHEPMDRASREFMALLGAAERASDAELASAWGAVIDHTVAHFELEDRWMRETRFAGAADHQLQHRVVLNLMRDGLAMARAGQCPAVRELVLEVAAWFSKHAQAMDAALALHMRHQPGPRPHTTARRKALRDPTA